MNVAKRINITAGRVLSKNTENIKQNETMAAQNAEKNIMRADIRKLGKITP